VDEVPRAMELVPRDAKRDSATIDVRAPRRPSNDETRPMAGMLQQQGKEAQSRARPSIAADVRNHA